MKYYSEITKKVYDTVNELKQAEDAVNEKANARKLDAEKVEKAFENLKNARAAYEKALREFCDKHGAYHKTIKNDDMSDISNTVGDLRELVNLLF